MSTADGRPLITDLTPGPGLALIAIICSSASIAVAGATIFYQVWQRLRNKDNRLDIKWNALFATALVVSVAQSWVTAREVNYGLGYKTPSVPPERLIVLEQLEYANGLLYVFSLFLLKGVHFLLQFITTFPHPNYIVPGIVMFGMLVFLFVAAFECQSPFWNIFHGKCINQIVFWYSFAAFDIITDLYSTSVVLHNTMGLHMKLGQKIKLIFIFGAKLLPIVCAVARIPFIQPVYTRTFFTMTTYRLAIPTQLQIHLSLSCLAIGKIFRFLSSLDVGYLSSAIEPQSRKNTQIGSYGYSRNRSLKTTTRRSSISDSARQLVPRDHGHTSTNIEVVPMHNVAEWNQGAKHGSNALQIHVTREVEVSLEHRER